MKVDLFVETSIRLYYDLHEPPATPAPLLIAVHGYGAHKRYMMKEARLVAPEHFAIASVQGPHQHFRQAESGYRVGFGWLTDHRAEESVQLHHAFLNDMIDKLASEGIADRTRVFLYGFSQACALNFRYAFTHPERVRGVIGACGGVPSDLDSNPSYARRLSADVLYLYGDDDEFYSSERFAEFDAKLSKRAENYRSVKYDAKHEITDAMRHDIREFLSDISA